jgi:hypothetical protein
MGFPKIQRTKGKISGCVDYGGMESGLGMDSMSVKDLEKELDVLEFTIDSCRFWGEVDL